MTTRTASGKAVSGRADDRPARIAALDVLRGIAVLLMIAYHGLWDATFLGLADLPLFSAWPWLAARTAILSLFLALAGAALTIAHADRFRPRPFLIRLAKIGLASALITVGTAMAFPGDYVFFGALHHIAAASVLALPLLRLPWPAVAAAGIAALILPSVAATGGAFSHLPLLVLGLSAVPPNSVDFVPLLPWFAATAAGLLAGRAILAMARRPDGAWLAWRPAGEAGRLLALAGRHSLVIYLVHQPPLMGVLWLLARLT